jgi:hypothetical protein
MTPGEYRATGLAVKTIFLRIVLLRRILRMLRDSRSAAFADAPKLPAIMLSSLRKIRSSSEAP